MLAEDVLIEIPETGVVSDDDLLRYAERVSAQLDGRRLPGKVGLWPRAKIYPFTFIEIETAAILSRFSIRHFRRIIISDRIRIVPIGEGERKKFFLLTVHLEQWMQSVRYRNREAEQDAKLKNLSADDIDHARLCVWSILGTDPLSKERHDFAYFDSHYRALAVFTALLTKWYRLKRRDVVPIVKHSLTFLNILDSRLADELNTDKTLSAKVGFLKRMFERSTSPYYVEQPLNMRISDLINTH